MCEAWLGKLNLWPAEATWPCREALLGFRRAVNEEESGFAEWYVPIPMAPPLLQGEGARGPRFLPLPGVRYSSLRLEGRQARGPAAPRRAG